MTMTTTELTVLPPAQSLDDLAAAVGVGPATLTSSDGQQVLLPEEILQVLSAVVSAMVKGQAVTIAPHNQTLTTQEAAGILGVSRPTIIRLLKAGRLPYHQPGRHRRILLRDVLAYAATRRHERGVVLDELVDLAEEAGMYEATATPRRTR